MQWEIWANSPTAGEWIEEFKGTHEECIRYFGLLEGSCRVWDFMLVNPNNSDKPRNMTPNVRSKLLGIKGGVSSVRSRILRGSTRNVDLELKLIGQMVDDLLK